MVVGDWNRIGKRKIISSYGVCNYYLQTKAIIILMVLVGYIIDAGGGGAAGAGRY